MPHARSILIATGNPGKYREIVAVLSEPITAGDVSVKWAMLRDLGLEIAEPVEDQPTFAGNAALKAMHYAKMTGMWTLADDSGLAVDALDGAPGVFSARYADASQDLPRVERDRANNQKLIVALSGVPLEKRTARFHCALAISDGERIIATAKGTFEGRIIDEARGVNGFGYDPHFYIPSLDKTAAELPAEQKNRLSHRGQALQRLRAILPGLLADD